MPKWTHITMFDRPYPAEKQAEGIAISQAIVGGHWNGSSSQQRRPTMSDLIERKAAISKIEPDEYYHSNEVKTMLQDIPAIDAVPVVWCKYCKWFAPNNGGEWYGCWLAEAIRVNKMYAPTRDDF